MADDCLLGIIKTKLGHWQKPSPVISFEVDKNSEVSLHHDILSLSLTVSLRMDDGKKPLFDLKEIAKQWLELEGEKKASISHD